MKINEKLDWILDSSDIRIKDDRKYRINIDFVHSLGLKCDCVGWSTLDLHDPRADEILNAIEAFCRENGWKARGIYTRNYSDYESEWYEIVPSLFKDNTLCEFEECEGEHGKAVTVFNIRAYRELQPSPKVWGRETILVPERFRDACIRHKIDDVDFCWAKDKGKYKAEQYFHLYCNNQIKSVAVGKNITLYREKITALGGYLPKIADIFYDLQQIDIQECFLESDIPKCNIAYAHSQTTNSHRGKNKYLIHKSLAHILLSEKAITEKDLTPALVVQKIPAGYTNERTVMPDRPNAEYIKKSISEYERLKNADRPLRTISEKDALKLLRTAKKERKTDFAKALPKSKASSVAKTPYSPILPYYLISNGGELSYEYELYPFEEAITENETFAKELISEELLSIKPNGILIGKCPDGDRILLCDNGKVIRFSHEEPVATEEWISLAQFVADCITD